MKKWKNEKMNKMKNERMKENWQKEKIEKMKKNEKWRNIWRNLSRKIEEKMERISKMKNNVYCTCVQRATLFSLATLSHAYRLDSCHTDKNRYILRWWRED